MQTSVADRKSMEIQTSVADRKSMEMQTNIVEKRNNVVQTSLDALSLKNTQYAGLKDKHQILNE